MGNLRSVEKAFKRLEVNVEVTNDPQKIQQASKLVLPGVGHFKSGMENLEKLNLLEILHKKVLDEKTPILGICLGMQLFTKHSEEGDAKGLNWIDAETKKFNFDKNSSFKVPHIGWNTVKLQSDCPLFQGTNSNDSYYFVHSYFVQCNEDKNLGGITDYGHSFDSCIYHENIIGVQFHPEKSHDAGIQLLKNFITTY